MKTKDVLAEWDLDGRRYKNYAPTGFDPKGYHLPDQQDWLVVPVGRNRDSGPFYVSNFRVAVEMLGGERSGVVEVHRFGHWGPGWFEIIIVNPRAGRSVHRAWGIACSLESYPVLNEQDLFDLEVEDQIETWENCYRSEFERGLERLFEDIDLPAPVSFHYDSIEDLVENTDLDSLFHVITERENIYWSSDNNGSQYIDLEAVIEAVSLNDLWQHTRPGEIEAENLARQINLF